jgi:hypothetical protein
MGTEEYKTGCTRHHLDHCDGTCDGLPLSNGAPHSVDVVNHAILLVSLWWQSQGAQSSNSPAAVGQTQ